MPARWMPLALLLSLLLPIAASAEPWPSPGWGLLLSGGGGLFAGKNANTRGHLLSAHLLVATPVGLEFGLALQWGRNFRTTWALDSAMSEQAELREHRTGTVFEALLPQLPPELAGYTWHAVGRLDVDSTGLLLFTNDDKLVAHATSPDARLPKRYVATVFSTASDERVEPLRRGMTLDDGPARPAKVNVRDEHTVEVTLTEGRHHQVKRMLGAVGLPVRALHREAVGGVDLEGIPEGTFRLLTDDEVREGLRYEGRAPSAP